MNVCNHVGSGHGSLILGEGQSVGGSGEGTGGIGSRQGRSIISEIHTEKYITSNW